MDENWSNFAVSLTHRVAKESPLQNSFQRGFKYELQHGLTRHETPRGVS